MDLFPYFPVIILIILYVLIGLGLGFAIIGDCIGPKAAAVFGASIAIFALFCCVLSFLIWLLNKLPWGFNIGTKRIGIGTIVGTIGLVGVILYLVFSTVSMIAMIKFRGKKNVEYLVDPKEKIKSLEIIRRSYNNLNNND